MDDPVRQHAFEQLLDPDPGAAEPTVALPALKKLCARGVPARWRPGAWQVLLRVREGDKRRWEAGERERVRGYYELLQHTIASAREDASTTLTPQDHLLLEIDDCVRAYTDTPRGRWIRPRRRRVTYPAAHSFEGESADYPSVDDRRAIRRRLERIRIVRDRMVGRGRISHDGDASTTPGSSSLCRPEITLSPSEDTSPRPHVRGPRAKRTRPMDKKDLSLEIPGPAAGAETTIIITAASPTTPSHPITLTPPPHEVTPSAGDDDDDDDDDDDASTHTDALIRLLAVLVRRSDVSPDEVPALVEWASIVYAVYVTDGDVEVLLGGQGEEDRWEENDQAEAEAFWVLQAMVIGVGLDEVVRGGGGGGGGGGGRIVARALARRVFWADEGLYRILVSESGGGGGRTTASTRWLADYSGQMSLRIDLEREPFVTEWTTHLFARTISPIHYLLPIWDAILSEDEDAATVPPDSTGKAELLVDVCTAMLLLVKDALRTIVESHPSGKARSGFWIEGEDDRLLFDQDGPSVPADQTEEKTAAARALLGAYPIRDVGIGEVLRVAWEVRQRRVMAILEGEDLGEIVLPTPTSTHRPDEEGLASRLESLAARAGSSVRESIHPLPRYTVPPLVDMDTVKTTLTTGGDRLKDYAHSLQASDAAAQVSKVSSNLTAVALMRLNSLSAGRTGEGDSGSGWSLGAARRLWSPGAKAEERSDTAAPAAVDEAERQESRPVASESPDVAISEEPAALFRRDTNLPPSFITPRGSIIYPAGRYRPKASAAGHGKSSLQSRLAAVAASPATQPAVAVSPERSSTVRPLILSRSAKPASPLHPSSASDAHAPGGPVGRMSPSPSLQNLDIVENYVARKVSISRRSQRSSVGSGDRDEPVAPVGHVVDSTSNRLRRAMRDSYPATADTQRYHLSDPGAKEEVERPSTPPPKDADPERYQLRDQDPQTPTAQDQAESPDSRRASVDGVAGGVTRSRVVRKGKFASKAAHFRLQSAGKIELNEEEKPRVIALVSGGEDASVLPARTSSLSQPATPVNGMGTEAAATVTPKSLILPERPERTSSLQNAPQEGPKRPSIDLHHLTVDGNDEQEEPLSAKDGYGDLLESYAAALESL